MAERQDATIDATAFPGLSAPTGDLATGEKFADRYLVDALIGRGGMGTVYRVRDTMVDEVVALKLLGVASVDVIERFRREVRLARRITSPHVARTHDLGSYAGLHYLTMELVEGTSLSRKLETAGPFSPARAARTGAAIARGLAAAHAAAVVHRDLKPDNVLIENGGRVVVTDFGIARALESDNARVTNGIAGTPAYMAPEQLSGAKVDARADLYALGVLLFELLSGELPFVGDTPIAMAVQRLHQPPRDLASLRSLPASIVDIVSQLLTRDPAARPADANAVAARLEELATQLDTGTRSSAGPISLGTAGTMGSIDLGAGTPPLTGLRPMTSTPSIGSVPRVIAVLPLTYRGPAETDYLSDGIADDLVDLVSRTRGLSALGRTSVADVAARDKDPRAIGRELHATHVLDGTIQASATKVRLSTRLFDGASGVQVWTDRQECDLDDAFAVQERLARRTAEALRLGLEGIVGSERMSAEAFELFMRARKQVRSVSGIDREPVVQTLDQLLALAPGFAPGHALHALACVRAWTMPREVKTRDWESEARASVQRALERAANVPESHHAAAILAMQDGQYADVARHSRAALALAPTYPESHLLLGLLKIEAGLSREGIESLERAYDIDTSLLGAIHEQARWHGLYGDLARYELLLARIGKEANEAFLWGSLELRVGAYRNDPERMRRGLAILSGSPHPIAVPMVGYGRTILREIPKPPMFTNGPAAFALTPRVRSVAMQMTAEVLGSLGETNECAACVETAAGSVLVDLDWMDRCPFLDEVRKLPAFVDWRRQVVTRCEAIWNG